MYQPFDPYHKWLGILPKDQPPNHYKLLGLVVFESDPDVIDTTANARDGQLRMYLQGEHGAEAQALLNEIAAARICLLDPSRKQIYDQQLRQKLASQQSQVPPVRQSPGVAATHTASAGQRPGVPAAHTASAGQAPNAIPRATAMPAQTPPAGTPIPSAVPTATPVQPGAAPVAGAAIPTATPASAIPTAQPAGGAVPGGAIPSAMPVGGPGEVSANKSHRSEALYNARRRQGMSQGLTIGLVLAILLFLGVGAIFVLGGPDTFWRTPKERPTPTYNQR